MIFLTSKEKKLLIITLMGISAVVVIILLLVLMSNASWIYHQAQKAEIAGKMEKANRFYEKYEDKREDQFENVEVGDTILYGFYEQDNNLKNGTEEIEWEVLAKEDDGILVISKYILDAKPYHEVKEGVNWDECTLRYWLNEEFLNTAFCPQIQERILLSEVMMDLFKIESNSYIGEVPVEDYIFLLCIHDVEKYYGERMGEKCQQRIAYVTNYAIAQGCVVEASTLKLREPRINEWHIPLTEPEYGQSMWWLRTGTWSKGFKRTQTYAGVITYTGRVAYHENSIDNFGVRRRCG